LPTDRRFLKRILVTYCANSGFIPCMHERRVTPAPRLTGVDPIGSLAEYPRVTERFCEDRRVPAHGGGQPLPIFGVDLCQQLSTPGQLKERPPRMQEQADHPVHRESAREY